MTDVNGTNSQAEELFDDATENFPSKFDLDTLVSDRNPDTQGRLLAIWARKNGSRSGDRGVYDYTETVTLVLDDGPDGNQTTDLVGIAEPGVGVRLDGFQFSMDGLTARLKPRVDGKNKAGVHLADKAYIGRINTRASTKVKGGSPAWSIAPATEDEKAWILEHYGERIAEINAEMAAKRKDADEQAAFG